MAQFMLILGTDPDAPNESLGKGLTGEQIMQKYGEWTRTLIEQKRLVESHKLFDGQGRRVTWSGGQATDGPFVETKETVGGYYVIEARDQAEAVLVAKTCPTVVFQGGWCEVRAVEI